MLIGHFLLKKLINIIMKIYDQTDLKTLIIITTLLCCSWRGLFKLIKFLKPTHYRP